MYIQAKGPNWTCKRVLADQNHEMTSKESPTRSNNH